MSGDAWAKDELRHMGECLKGLMRLATYNTRWIQSVRAEGWVMQGFVQVYQATQDASLKAYAIRRRTFGALPPPEEEGAPVRVLRPLSSPV